MESNLRQFVSLPYNILSSYFGDEKIVNELFLGG